uniref:Integrase catalytic domain-containing protein n=1 Tax=Strongyloides venezuelensis TaxID=75913 RepID=A0A0K0FWI2_STRVS
MAKKLFEEYHLKKGHLSVAKIKDDLIKECYKLMISKYKAVMIINKIMDMIKNCETCQLENDLKRRKRDKADPKNVLEILYMDFMFLDNHTILVAEDGYSRYIWAEEGPQADEKLVIQLLNRILDQCQIKIKEIRADKAKVFKGKEFLAFLKKNDIKLNYAVSYEHYANSKVERAIRTLRHVRPRRMYGTVKLLI